MLNFYDSSAVEIHFVDREGFSFPRGPKLQGVFQEFRCVLGPNGVEGGCGSPSPPSGDGPPPAFDGCYLVDPASSHMLVSKTKPCMSKYKRCYTVKLRMAH